MGTISLVLLLLSLTFCQKEPNPKQLMIALPTDPPSLDPLLATDLSSQKISRFLYSHLYKFQGAKVNKDLVEEERVYVTKGEQVWHLRLQEKHGLRAKDVQYSLERLLSSNSPRVADYKFLHSVIVNGEREVSLYIDSQAKEWEVKEKLALPFAAILKENALGSSLFSSFGDYEVTEWKKNEYLDLKRKEENNSLPESVRLQILPQSTTSLFLYKKQKLDAFKLSDFMLNLEIADEKHSLSKRGRSIQYVAINHNNPCFDLAFRKALNFAIPREFIIEKILYNKADPIVTSIPLPFYEEVFKEKRTSVYVFDTEKANAYLKSSKCYPNILDQKIEFRMRADDENQTKGRAIVEALKSLGLNVQIKGMEKAPLYKENGEGKGDLTLLTWYSDYPSIWNFLDPLFHDQKLGNSGNRAHYKNAALTKLLDEKKDLKMAKQIIGIIENEAPWIFLWSLQENYLISDKFIQFPKLSDYL